MNGPDASELLLLVLLPGAIWAAGAAYIALADHLHNRRMRAERGRRRATVAKS